MSVEQGPGPLHEEGSSAIARVWWDRTIDQRLICDGELHTEVVQPRQKKGWPSAGRAWVQFCVVAADSPTGQPAVGSYMHYRQVVKI